MKELLSIMNVESKSPEKEWVSHPRKCPICDTSYGGNCIAAYSLPQYSQYGNNIENYLLYVLYHCNYCNKLFLSIYNKERFSEKGYQLEISVPREYHSIDLPESIRALSPMFEETYNDAYEAECHGLNTVCGLGYRKALEFLVKDYLIYKEPNEADIIAKMPLNTAIQQKIDDKKIKVLAERCAWLGNDEAHYVRKHEEYNVSDLKDFLNAITSYINTELLVEKAYKIERK